MPIQFRCAQCNQPIEVDDVYARQAVTCPYCRQVVTAPDRSMFTADEIPTARPGGFDPQAAAAYSQPGAAGVPYPAPFQITAESPALVSARTYGTAALICSVVGVLMFFGLMAWGAVTAMRYYKEHGEPPTNAAAERYIEENANPAIVVGTTCGLVAFAVAGLVLAIISLSHSASGNWRGWVALVISSLMLLGFGCTVMASMQVQA
jgi:hypothetical protein